MFHTSSKYNSKIKRFWYSIRCISYNNYPIIIFHPLWLSLINFIISVCKPKIYWRHDNTCCNCGYCSTFSLVKTIINFNITLNSCIIKSRYCINSFHICTHFCVIYCNISWFKSSSFYLFSTFQSFFTSFFICFLKLSQSSYILTNLW